MNRIRRFACMLLALLLTVSCAAAARAEETEGTEETLYIAVSDHYCAVRGDVNGDGKITSADARTILRAAVNLIKVDAKDRAAYAVDDIYTVTAADARAALRIAVGLEARPVHVKEREYVTQEPTCFDIGIYALQCMYCHDLYDFGALPVKEHFAAGWVTIRKATCTATGLREMRCLNCDTLMDTDILPKTDHTYGDLQFESETPDCAKAQNIYWVCINCGHIKKSIWPPTAHKYEWVTVKAPTCTELGFQEEVCKVCGMKSGNTQNMFSLGGHLPSGWVIVKYATRTEEGLRQKTCTRCGILLEEEVIPKIGS